MLAVLMVSVALPLRAATAFTRTTLHVPGDFPTIQAALDAASRGDRVLVDPGTYSEVLRFRQKDVRLSSSGGPAVTVLAIPSGDLGVKIGPGGAFKGFRVTGGGFGYFDATMHVLGRGTLMQHNVLVPTGPGLRRRSRPAAGMEPAGRHRPGHVGSAGLPWSASGQPGALERFFGTSSPSTSFCSVPTSGSGLTWWVVPTDRSPRRSTRRGVTPGSGPPGDGGRPGRPRSRPPGRPATTTG